MYFFRKKKYRYLSPVLRTTLHDSQPRSQNFVLSSDNTKFCERGFILESAKIDLNMQ